MSAKSMATSYLNTKRLQQHQQQQATATSSKSQTLSPARFKSSTSNLVLSGGQQASRLAVANNSASKLRLKSTSMSNLTAGSASQQHQDRVASIQRPASRNALDSIHNGMNAKYAQVQSKVLLQNIKPSNTNAISKIPSNNSTKQQQRPAGASAAVKAGSGAMKSDRTQLLNKLKQLQEELERCEQEREALKLELDREKADKAEQVQQIKFELQEKLAEHDKQNEDYHQKLLEAYELADQNRRATDSVLAGSRQRDEESRKRIEELETQLGELKEFVSMKEEMTGKMFELREQLREERERYEEQLKSLHQVFENEKISSNFNGAKQNSQNLLLDQNSNYFNRVKPTLESNESIDKLRLSQSCHKCRLSGSACSAQHLHRSEQDIYGSKLSTRMKGQARSAWRASKQFASSVITGGVGLSACRQCTRRSPGSPEVARRQQPLETLTFSCQQQQPISAEFVSSCLTNDNDNHDERRRELESLPVQADQQQHTSVIQLESSRAKAQDNQLQQQQAAAAAAGNGLISVGANNKLTIVTKFQELDGSANNNSIAASSNVSERSRCESSSSGRGTSSSDSGSADSQNGDSVEPNQVAEQQQKTSGEGQNAALPVKDDSEAKRSHKRGSSLFKASKVFGGSQASLSKLRSFFSAAGSKRSSAGSAAASQNVCVDSSLDHLESSRLRCLELNQAANKAALISAAGANEHPGDAGCVVKVEIRQQVQSEVGQGDANEDKRAKLDGSEEHQKQIQYQQQQQQPVLAV